MRTTTKRVSVPFLFRASNGIGANGNLIARSYGQEVEGVFTRAGQANAADQVSRLYTAPYGGPRYTGDQLLLEGGTTNYLLRSQEFDNASWSKTNVTVTANAATAPDGTTTADKVAATASAATTFSQTEATINSAVVTYSIHGKIGSGATDANAFVIRNATTASDLFSVTINWTTGAVTTAAGSGVARALEMTNGWWRLEMTVSTGVTPGDDITVYAGFIGGTETAGEYAYLWGAQLEASTHASSYVVTTSATAARVAETLYFPFTLPPQACTIYIYGLEQSRPSVADPTLAQVYLTLGDNSGDPRLLIHREVTRTGYSMLHDPATSTQTAVSTIGTAATRGDIVELRGVLGSDGACTLGVSVNFGAEATDGPSTAQALGTAWNPQRLYLHSTASGINPVAFGYAIVCIALGTKTLSEMRDLADQGIF